MSKLKTGIIAGLCTLVVAAGGGVAADYFLKGPISTSLGFHGGTENPDPGDKTPQTKPEYTLQTPSNVALGENLILTWDAVQNANYYKVQAGGEDFYIDGTSFDIRQMKINSTDIQISAVGSEKADAIYKNSTETVFPFYISDYMPDSCKNFILDPNNIFMISEITDVSIILADNATVIEIVGPHIDSNKHNAIISTCYNTKIERLGELLSLSANDQNFTHIYNYGVIVDSTPNEAETSVINDLVANISNHSDMPYVVKSFIKGTESGTPAVLISYEASVRPTLSTINGNMKLLFENPDTKEQLMASFYATFRRSDNSNINFQNDFVKNGARFSLGDKAVSIGMEAVYYNPTITKLSVPPQEQVAESMMFNGGNGSELNLYSAGVGSKDYKDLKFTVGSQLVKDYEGNKLQSVTLPKSENKWIYTDGKNRVVNLEESFYN